MHRDHWVADVAGLVLTAVIVAAAWAAATAFFGWSWVQAVAIGTVWLWGCLAAWVANNVQAWLWRRVRYQRVRRRT